MIDLSSGSEKPFLLQIAIFKWNKDYSVVYREAFLNKKGKLSAVSEKKKKKNKTTMFNLTRSYNCIRKLRYTCFRIFSENSFLTFYGNYETVAATEPARLIYLEYFLTVTKR